MARSSLKYSPFNCGAATWDITFANNSQASQYMMDWLLHWEFDCNGKSVYREAAHNGGLGSSFMFASKYFMEGIEYRSVYRPDHGNVPWMWAAVDSENCTLHKQSYDCFSEPISDCAYAPSDWTRSPALLKELARVEREMPNNPLRDMKSAQNMDVCTFARVLKKPVKWVHGHLMWYMMRPSSDLRAIVEKRKKDILHQAPRGTVSMSMQVRSGPMVDERKPLKNLEDVIQIADTVVAEIEEHRSHLLNSKVGIVYLSSDLPEMTYRSAEFMNTNYPRSFKWVTSNHISLGQNVEAEIYILEHNGKLEVSQQDLFVDFLVDVEIMTGVDYLLGAKSNVYMLAAGLRMIRQQPHYHQPRNTCYIAYGGESGQWKRVCEGDEEHKATWRYYFNPEYTQFESYPNTFPAIGNVTVTSATQQQQHHHLSHHRTARFLRHESV